MKRMAIVVAVILLAAGTASMAYSYGSGGPGVIESSYAFDTSDPALMAGFADAIVVGRVDGIESIDRDNDRTHYTVSIGEILKGSAEKSIIVSQLGYRTRNGAVVDSEQSMLEVGSRYFLVLKRVSPGRYSVTGGPIGAEQADTANSADIRARWATGIANQKDPMAPASP